ncbi:MAG: ATP-dependent Clp protease adaptor ClpS [Treponema sp.]|nr:ATP-dependent Clp protease adaptor ClpS [Treponema sp.]
MSDWKETSDNDTGVMETTDFDVPPNYAVRLYNDDYTTKDFVVAVLERVFHKSEVEAVTLMETVHKEGSAIVGVYTYDIAATRAELTRTIAREEGFPLRVDIVRVV